MSLGKPIGQGSTACNFLTVILCLESLSVACAKPLPSQILIAANAESFRPWPCSNSSREYSSF